MDDIKDWTGRNVEELLRLAENRSVWSRVVMNIASPYGPMASGHDDDDDDDVPQICPRDGSRKCYKLFSMNHD